MAQYTVTHSCGHSRTVSLFGKTSEREQKLEWMKTTLCPECYKAALKEEANKNGFAELVGSEKQIVWANSIRNDFYKRFPLPGMTREQMIARTTVATEYIDKILENETSFSEAHQQFFSETSAKVWIERRNLSSKELLLKLTTPKRALDLPELKGSEKQIAWAEEIREKILNAEILITPEEAQKNIEAKEIPSEKLPGVRETLERYAANYHTLISQDKASFWIDIRNESAAGLFRDMVGLNNYWEGRKYSAGYIVE